MGERKMGGANKATRPSAIYNNLPLVASLLADGDNEFGTLL